MESGSVSIHSDLGGKPVQDGEQKGTPISLHSFFF